MLRISCSIGFFCLFLLANILCANESSQSGKLIREKKDLDPFTSISISGNANLFIKTGTQEQLNIETDPQYISQVKAEVQDGRLSLEPNNDNEIPSSAPINYYLTVNHIDRIEITGGSTVSSKDTLSGEQFLLEINGNGKADLKLKVNKLDTTIAGAAQIKLQGSVTEQFITVNGMCMFDGRKLNSKNATVVLNGSSTINLHATQVLDIKIAGNGKVQYSGHPQISQEIRGGGEIIPIE